MGYANAMFGDCDGISDWSPLKDWNTHNLKKADYMFYSCRQLTNLAMFTNWDVGSLEYAREMFEECNLTTLAGLENWNMQAASNIRGMFAANQLTDIGAVSTWFNQANRLRTLQNVFSENYQLNDISALRNWNVASVTDFTKFLAYTNVTSVEALSAWDTSNATDLSGIFKETELKTLDGLQQWNVSRVADFGAAFMDLPYLNDASAINAWDLSSGTKFDKMFALSRDNQYICNSALPIFTVRTGKFDSNGTFIPDN